MAVRECLCGSQNRLCVHVFYSTIPLCSLAAAGQCCFSPISPPLTHPMLSGRWITLIRWVHCLMGQAFHVRLLVCRECASSYCSPCHREVIRCEADYLLNSFSEDGGGGKCVYSLNKMSKKYLLRQKCVCPINFHIFVKWHSNKNLEVFVVNKRPPPPHFLGVAMVSMCSSVFIELVQADRGFC